VCGTAPPQYLDIKITLSLLRNHLDVKILDSP